MQGVLNFTSFLSSNQSTKTKLCNLNDKLVCSKCHFVFFNVFDDFFPGKCLGVVLFENIQYLGVVCPEFPVGVKGSKTVVPKESEHTVEFFDFYDKGIDLRKGFPQTQPPVIEQGNIHCSEGYFPNVGHPVFFEVVKPERQAI